LIEAQGGTLAAVIAVLAAEVTGLGDMPLKSKYGRGEELFLPEFS
jgi:hypothetical protein